jgi:hypothetical protein
LQGLLLQIDEAEIVAHEANDPNTVIDFFNSQERAPGSDLVPIRAFRGRIDGAVNR